jgi:hypothetical protein
MLYILSLQQILLQKKNMHRITACLLGCTLSDFSSHDKDELFIMVLNDVLLCRIFGYMTVLISFECVSAVPVARFAALLS